MGKILKIITDPNPILRQQSKKIDLKDIRSKKFQQLCADMSMTMRKKDGVGLAAPQIGQNIRMIVVASKDGPKCVINPILIQKSWSKEWGEEGCLSVPNQYGEVKRHKKTICAYFDNEGQKIIIETEGLMARILQHEIDHLDGILFIDKARKIKKVEGHKIGNKEKIKT